MDIQEVTANWEERTMLYRAVCPFCKATTTAELRPDDQIEIRGRCMHTRSARYKEGVPFNMDPIRIEFAG
jgi:hypothetical protein